MGNKNIFSKIKKYISKLLDSKILIVIGLLLVFVVMLFSYIKPIEIGANDKKNYSDDVVAYMGDKKISFYEIEKRAEEIFYFDKKNIIENIGTDVYKRELAKYVICEEVLYKKAKEENVHVTREEIDETYENLKEFITNQFGIDEDEFKSKYADDKRNLVASMRKSIKAYKYLDKETEVSESEAREYYEANKDRYKEGVFRDIFISTVDSSGERLSRNEVKDAENRAYNVYEKLKEGYDFEELEDKYSEDVKGTIPGGIGDLEMDFDDESIRRKIFELEEGEIIEGPLESSYGYHIVKRIGTETEPFSKVKEEIKSMLAYKKQIKLVEGLMEEYKVRFTDKYK